MTELVLVTPHEVAVANALRARAWRWLDLSEIVEAARQYHKVSRRSVRGRLTGLARDGLAERKGEGELVPYLQAHWRWAREPDPGRLAGFEAACAVEQLLLEPVVVDGPEFCALGHAYAVDGEVFLDGSRRCDVCLSVTR